MSKKQDFLRSEQSRDQHPDRAQVGGPARTASSDTPGPHAGKVANDHNKIGGQPSTQTNQGQRTPESRNDRQALGSGPQNQVSARKGGAGAGRTPRGAG